MCTQCTQSTLCVPSRLAQALIYNLSICLLSLLLWTLSSSAYQQWKLSYFVARERVLRGKCHQSRFFPLLKVPTHVRCACGCLTCKGVFGCFSRSRFAGAYFKIERFRLKLWILTLIPGKMNAVSVPSPSHFVKHLSPLWHTCTLPHQFAHCETLDNTVAQMHTSLHTTSKLHTLWNTRGHRRHLRRLETLKDTRKLEDTRNTWGHRRRLKTLKDTIAKKFCTPQTTLHGLVRKHCILVSLKTEIRTQKTLYPCITLKTENTVSLYPCIPLNRKQKTLYHAQIVPSLLLKPNYIVSLNTVLHHFIV